MRFALLLVSALFLTGSEVLAQGDGSQEKAHFELIRAPLPTILVPPTAARTEDSRLPDSPAPKLTASPCASRASCQEPFVRPYPGTLNTPLRKEVRRHRVADKKFWLLSAAAVGSAVLNAAAVKHCRHTAGIENCEGEYGPYSAMQGLNIGLSIGMAAVGYWAKKIETENGLKHRLWWTIPAGTAAFYGVRGIQQYSKHCPAGTHFNGDDCR